MGGIIKVEGLVSEVKAGFVRVKLPTYDDIVTDWLHIVKLKAMNDHISFPYEVDEQVACIVDEYCKTGYCLGAINSEADPEEEGAEEGKFRMLFEDGTLVEYDKVAHKLTVQVVEEEGEINVLMGEDTSIVVKDKDVKVMVADTMVQATDTKITLQTDSSGEVYAEAGSSTVSIKDNLIKLNGGTLGGLIKIVDLVSKINALENDLTALKAVFTGWAPVPNDGGAALKLAITGYASSAITPTTQMMIEDTKVTH